MKDKLLYLAKNLADHPEKLDVESVEEGDATKLTLKVAEEDKGKMIGKQGKVIKALRAVMQMIGIKQNKNVAVDLG